MIKVFYLLCFLLSSVSYGEELTFEEKQEEVLNYSNIKSILKNDGLSEHRSKKKKMVKEMQSVRQDVKVSRYNYPSENDFWRFATELWLVKNVQKLRWDFPKPKYGIVIAFKQLLEKFSFYNVKFKILIVNTPNISHYGLPLGKNEFLFVLSLPFIRSLDLTKVDISLLLLEDFLRLKKEYFKSNVKLDLSFLGKNFYGKKLDNKILTKTLGKYDEFFFDKGFSFQQQFEVTKEISSLLKSEPVLWGTYFKLYKNIDRFIKTDILYRNYLKIYPSPEMQIQWLSPKKEVI